MAQTGSLRLDLYTWVQSVFLGFLCFQMIPCISAEDNTVFFNNYGDCTRSKPLELNQGKVTLKSYGGAVAYEANICPMTFHSTSHGNTCFYFREFHISNCDVTLKIYPSKSASGRPLRTLSCGDQNPGRICSTSRYLSVILTKLELTQNKGYTFLIDLKAGGGRGASADAHWSEGDEFDKNRSEGPTIGRAKESDKRSTPLFPIVLCVLGVIVIIAVVTTAVLYSCRRQGGVYTGGASRGAAARGSRFTEDVEGNVKTPSAPPMEEPPPPYVDPPPYDGECHSGRNSGDVYENMPMMTNR